MSISTHSGEGHHTIQVKGHFNYTLQANFRRAYESVQHNCHYIVDFVETHGIDYSAIGMLLLLREHSSSKQGDARRVKLINCNHEIHGILDMLNLHHIFEIHHTPKLASAA